LRASRKRCSFKFTGVLRKVAVQVVTSGVAAADAEEFRKLADRAA
jgi:hypothetical protein